MTNIRALKLLSKPLERDVFVKNSTRELGMLACKKFSEQTKRVENSRKQGVYVDQTVVIFRSLLFINLPLLSLSYRLLIISNAGKCVSHSGDVCNLI